MSEKLRLPLEKLYHWEKTTPHRACLNQPSNGNWRTLTWAQAADEARRVAAALKALELPPGSCIAILSKNSAHWILADLAIWLSGHVSVPLYPNTTTETVRQILEHCEARAIFVGHLDDASITAGIPSAVRQYFLPRAPGEKGANWDELVAGHAPLTGEIRRAAGELATLIYTSGTTGVPKGVMHSFRSIASSGSGIQSTHGLGQEDVYFSYLPLAHVAERLVVETALLYSGGQVYFVESQEKFAANLRQVQPTVFLAVPRIWAKFQQGVLAKVPSAKLDRLLRLPLIGSVIARKLRRELGLSRVRVCITGAAPIAVSLIEWFARLGIEVQEAYAMSENFAYSHCNLPGKTRLGAVGQAFPGVIAKVSAEGEVLVASPGMMDGYYRDPQATAAVFDGEFLRTGDRGAIDADGYLRLTGRVKELFKTSKGKYVAPAPIESRLSRCEHIDQVCVMGAGFPQPIALVTLTEGSRVADSALVGSQLDAVVGAVNGELPPHEQLSNLVVLPDNWTIENGSLTPTLKVKRAAIEARYADALAQWSYHPSQVIWHQ